MQWAKSFMKRSLEKNNAWDKFASEKS